MQFEVLECTLLCAQAPSWYPESCSVSFGLAINALVTGRNVALPRCVDGTTDFGKGGLLETSPLSTEPLRDSRSPNCQKVSGNGENVGFGEGTMRRGGGGRECCLLSLILSAFASASFPLPLPCVIASGEAVSVLLDLPWMTLSSLTMISFRE